MSEGGRPGGRRAGSLLGAPVMVRDRCKLGKFILWWVSKPGRGGGEEEGGNRNQTEETEEEEETDEEGGSREEEESRSDKVDDELAGT